MGGGVEPFQCSLRAVVASRGPLVEPFTGERAIPRDARAALIDSAEIGHADRSADCGALFIPAARLIKIDGDSGAKLVVFAEIMHREAIPQRRRFLKPLVGRGIVPGYTRTSPIEST